MDIIAIKGYKRDNGKVGIRNKLLVLPSVLCSSGTSTQIAEVFPDAVSIANQAGCAQVGDDLIQTERTLMGFGNNPNIGGVLVVGLGCEGVHPLGLANKVADSKKLVKHLVIQQVGGTVQTIEQGIEEAGKILKAIDKPRETVQLSDICIGIVIDDHIEENKITRLMNIINDISEIAGAIIIPEKYKNYIKSEMQSLDYAREVENGGVYCTAAKSGKISLMTGMVASGAQLLLHFTSDGDPAASSIAPVIKCSVDHDIYQIFDEHIDLDISVALEEDNAELITSQLYTILLNTMNGTGTKSEELGMNDFAIHRILPSF